VRAKKTRQELTSLAIEGFEQREEKVKQSFFVLFLFSFSF